MSSSIFPAAWTAAWNQSVPRWLRRLILSVFGLLSLLVVLLLITWAALPFWLERQGVRMVGQQLGREVSLEAAHFTPWRLALTLDRLRIAGPQAGTPDLLAVQRVEVVLSPRTLWRFTPIVSSLKVEQPAVHLTLLGHGHTDVDDILARLRSRPVQPDESSRETPLALYNLELSNGRVQLEDRAAGMTHQLTALQLGLPFISTLDTDVEVTVAPHLSGQVNGVPFSTEAQAQPFAQTRTASLQFKMDALDLSAYRAYWPRTLPVRLASGLVDANLTVKFQLPKDQTPSLGISGTAEVRDLALQRRAETNGSGDPAAAGWSDWLRWKRVRVGVADLQPLKRQVLLDRLLVEAPALQLTREASGQIWLPVPQGDAVKDSERVAAAPPVPPAPAASAAASAVVQSQPAPGAWRVSIRELDLTEGRVSLLDAAVSPAGDWRLQDLTVTGKALNWPLASPAASITVAASLKGSGSGASTGGGSANLKASGQAATNGLNVDWELNRVALAWLAPYLRSVTPLQVRGELAAQGQFRADAQGHPGALRLKDVRLTQVDVLDGGKPAISLAEASLDQATVELNRHDVQLGRLLMKEPQVQLARDARGAWNWAAWQTPAAAVKPPVRVKAEGRPVLRLSDPAAPEAGETASSARSAPAVEVAPTPVPWRLRLGELIVEGGQVQLLDQSTHVLDDEPIRPIGVQELSLRLARLDWDGAQLRGEVPGRLSLITRRPDAKIRSVRDPAKLQWEGQLSFSPVRLTGKVLADHLPLHWADPYLDPSIGIHLQRAEGSFKGDAMLALLAAGPQLQASGDLQLSDLRLRQTRLQDGRRRSAEDLLSWQALRLAGLKLQMAPAAVPDIAIRQASLDEFYARLIVNEQGRLNLRDLRQTSQGQAIAAVAGSAAASEPVSALIAATGGTPAASAASASGAVSAAGSGPSAREGSSPGGTATATGAAAASGPPLRLSINNTQLTAGRLDFTDRFIKPNYTAQISDLTGSLGRFSAGASDMAPLQLKGRVAGTGLLDVNGQINPGSLPLTLDITASATDIELAPLSPYAGKYAGYAIERGKLSSRVHYRIDPSGQLVADNKIILNQLSFGDRIDSPVATKLPVRLAVALLKDSNGVIDVNLPVSGSINDPEFSVGGVIGRLIVNLLAKALTAPFSLLSGGGGADMSHLSFDPGTAALPAATDQALDHVAKVLKEKPSLQLSITGWVDPVAERRAAQAARLEDAMINERRRELRRQQLLAPAPVSAPAARAAGSAATSGDSSAGGEPDPSGDTAAAQAARTAPPAATPISLDDAQRQRLLKVVYDNSKLPNKPRNFLGLAKDLPPADMRELLLDSYVVTDEQMRELALQRSVAVRDALISKGVPNARMFLASPKLHESKDSTGQAWSPKVDLSLATQ
ncbi:DUF748 domain-containing protein [Roseateles terrae]|uniref:Uncharacterized protein involved in outer membrane biogenesis n=1 Tax=Roseateles terrae TaxID=431060 RepID=A0ABR6GLM8_9BURK|nr:DUF748 domain-containing protein [Roseateles terrae]MBB3193009.1 uncharacterized protein involved in outer membrane biogenesis [Roseateles terrae]